MITLIAITQGNHKSTDFISLSLNAHITAAVIQRLHVDSTHVEGNIDYSVILPRI